VHAIVTFKNGTTYFLYHEPDMKIPISNALFDSKINYSKYFQMKNTKKFTDQNLEFFPADKNKFTTLKLIPKMNSNRSAPIILNAANEIFVDEFLKNNILFNDIFTCLKLVTKDRNYIKTSNMHPNSINNIYKIDSWARNLSYQIIKNKI
jgi:1-deoxy-D-xylulose-5-phosphate reductoisomerase